MGWVTLTLRKTTLKQQINQAELRDIEISRERRSVQRHKAYETTIFENDKKAELNEAQASYKTIRDNRTGLTAGTEAYTKWEQEYNAAKEDWEAKKLTINDYYDDIKAEIEEEATDEETRLDEEQTTLEAQLEALRSELESVSEQISSDIDSSKIKLS